MRIKATLLTIIFLLVSCSTTTQTSSLKDSSNTQEHVPVKVTTTIKRSQSKPTTTIRTTTTQKRTTKTTSTTKAPRATTTKAVRTTTTTNSYKSPNISLDCGPKIKGNYDWYEPIYGYSFGFDGNAGFKKLTFDYGDGKGYTSTSVEDAEKNSFWHKYYSPGNYKVTATLEDGVGKKVTASCNWTWEGVQATASNGLSSSNSGGLSSSNLGCPSDFYVDTNGYCVLSPTLQPYIGWTALCNDGYYSYSQNRSGTCSNHGGVNFFRADQYSTATNFDYFDLSDFDLNIPSIDYNYGGTYDPSTPGYLPTCWAYGGGLSSC